MSCLDSLDNANIYDRSTIIEYFFQTRNDMIILEKTEFVRMKDECEVLLT